MIPRSKKEITMYIKNCEYLRARILDMIIDEIRNENADVDIAVTTLLQLMGDMLLCKNYTHQEVNDFKTAVGQELSKRFNASSVLATTKGEIIDEL